MKNLVLRMFCLTLFLVSCSSQQPFRISSEPKEADVAYYDFKQKRYVDLGKTPIDLKEPQIEAIKNQDVASLKISKGGYIIEKVYLDVNSRKEFKIHSNLSKIDFWIDHNDEVNSKIANSITSNVQRINQYIVEREYDKAMKLVQFMIEKFPKAHVFYDIKASLHILKGQKTAGRTSLEKSIQINPDNKSAREILDALKRNQI